MPFGFLKRRHHDEVPGAASGKPGAAASSAAPRAIIRGVAFTALTEDWRLHGRMQIAGRLWDALNHREAISIAEVTWGATDAATLDPAPGLKSVDPYDLILVTSGEDSMPPLSETERAALKVHKVPYDVVLEVPPFRVFGTVFLHSGSEPEGLLARSTEMFLPVVDAVARLGDVEVNDPDVDVILVNRYYLRGVAQVDKHAKPRDVPPSGDAAGG